MHSRTCFFGSLAVSLSLYFGQSLDRRSLCSAGCRMSNPCWQRALPLENKTTYELTCIGRWSVVHCTEWVANWLTECMWAIKSSWGIWSVVVVWNGPQPAALLIATAPAEEWTKDEVYSDVYKVVEWKETKVKMICTGVWPRRRTTQPVKLIRTWAAANKPHAP